MNVYSLCRFNSVFALSHTLVLLNIHMKGPIRTVQRPEVGLANGEEVRPEAADNILTDVK